MSQRTVKIEALPATKDAQTAPHRPQAYIAEGRVKWVKACLELDRLSAHTVLVYRCGVGVDAALLADVLEPSRLVGIDDSIDALRLAREHHGSASVRFVRHEDYAPRGHMDLAYWAGSLHTVVGRERLQAVRYLRRALIPGGVLAIWGLNTWSCASRRVLRAARGGVRVRGMRAGQVERLLQRQGFDILRVDYLTPSPETDVAQLPPARRSFVLPFGDEFLVLARKQSGAVG